jgi:hypothetical protein
MRGRTPELRKRLRPRAWLRFANRPARRCSGRADRPTDRWRAGRHRRQCSQECRRNGAGRVPESQHPADHQGRQGLRRWCARRCPGSTGGRCRTHHRPALRHVRAGCRLRGKARWPAGDCLLDRHGRGLARRLPDVVCGRTGSAARGELRRPAGPQVLRSADPRHGLWPSGRGRLPAVCRPARRACGRH